MLLVEHRVFPAIFHLLTHFVPSSRPLISSPSILCLPLSQPSVEEEEEERAWTESKARLLRESKTLSMSLPVEGWLLKKGAVGLLKGWKRRYFCMNLDLNRLVYTLEPQSTRELGHINLHSIRSVFIVRI
jgi:PH domain